MTVFSPRTIKHIKGIERHPIGLIQKKEKKQKQASTSNGSPQSSFLKRLVGRFDSQTETISFILTQRWTIRLFFKLPSVLNEDSHMQTFHVNTILIDLNSKIALSTCLRNFE
jgi:hypothetical protein